MLPVSYTHLDVYKRQVQYNLFVSMLPVLSLSKSIVMTVTAIVMLYRILSVTPIKSLITNFNWTQISQLNKGTLTQ